jgi:hypothetical protein
VLKKFFLKVHPDRYAQYPEISKTNNESFQSLQSFLQHISSVTENGAPPAKCQQLIFYTWAPQQQHHHHHQKNSHHVLTDPAQPEPAPKLRRIAVNLRTSGGDCRHLVYKTLTDMFGQADLATEFSWGDAYWSDGKVFFILLNFQVNFELISYYLTFHFPHLITTYPIQLPTLDELKDQMADEMAAREMEEKGFKSEEEEAAFYRARARKTSTVDSPYDS